jgi:hypothetical protein
MSTLLHQLQLPLAEIETAPEPFSGPQPLDIYQRNVAQRGDALALLPQGCGWRCSLALEAARSPPRDLSIPKSMRRAVP